MSKDKYSNGMYKMTSKLQELVANSIFRAFKENRHHAILEYMSMNFDQASGLCEYMYYFENSHTVYYVQLNRDGKIITSGYTTR